MIGQPPAIPFRYALSGTCDANGNVTISGLKPSQGQYGLLTLVAKVSSGAPQWELQVFGGGPPLGFAGGQRASIGAVYTYPGETLAIVVTGATPKADVSGAFYGFLADDPDGLPAGAPGGGGTGGGGGTLPTGQQVVRGTLTNVSDTVAISAAGSTYISFGFGTGVLATGSSIIFEGTADDANWFPIPFYGFGSAGASAWNPSGAINGSIGFQNFVPVVASGGLSQVRCRLSGVGGGQTALNAVLRATPEAALPPPTGSQTTSLSVPVVVTGNVAGSLSGVVEKKDTGRSAVLLSWEEMAGTAAAESALTNFTLGSYAGAALGAATSYTVTATKTLHIQSITIYLKSTSTAAILARFRIRAATSGVGNASPVIFDAVLGLDAATFASGQADELAIPIPDGLEVPAATPNITFTWFTSVNTCTVGLALVGYEYGP